jgi:hypothetical protein
VQALRGSVGRWVRALGALVGYLFVGRLLPGLATEVWGPWVGVALGVVLVAGLAVFLVREQRRYHAPKARHDADA